MMRYVSIFCQPTIWPGESNMTADFVQEQDKTPVKTGLLDAMGTPIYRIEDVVQLGFALPK